MSVFHRVDDIYSLDGPTLISRAVRLPYYQGVMQVRLSEQLQELGQQSTDAESLPAVQLGRPGTPPPGASTIPDRHVAEVRRRSLYRKAG